MLRRQVWVATVVGILVSGSAVRAQSPGVIYTWNGTGDIRQWRHDTSQPNFTNLSNSIAGQLTVTEIGDEFDPGSTDPGFYGASHIFSDSWDFVREGDTGSGAAGGIDLTGLQFIEIDVSHNGTGNVSVQPFVGTGVNSTYTWFGPGPDYLPSGAAWVVPPGSGPTTLRIPVYSLTPAQQAYSRLIGVKVFDHADQGYLTWTVSEVRSTGTPLTVRELATHDVGTSDSGLNGAFGNFELAAIVGNDGGQNQSGLSQNTSGSGSLQWTDKGNGGNTQNPSGAAVSWGNGTALNGNTFYERPADFSNYNRVTFRMSATDVTPGGGGSIGVQAFFQTSGAYNYQTTSGGAVGQFGEIQLPVDGQFHDLVYPITNVTNRNIVPTFGVNLFSHLNDVLINVDRVRFEFVAGVPGDFNGNGTVDAADYVLWRNGGPLQNEVDTPGTVNAADYTAWRARFGNTSGSGSVNGAAIPEPSCTLLALLAVGAGRASRWRQR